MNITSIGAGLFIGIGLIMWWWYNDLIGLLFIILGIAVAIVGLFSSIKYGKVLEDLKRGKL